MKTSTLNLFDGAAVRWTSLRRGSVAGMLAAGLFLVTGCGESTAPSLDDETERAATETALKTSDGSVADLICPPGDPNCTRIGGTGDEGIEPPDLAYLEEIYIVVYGATTKGGLQVLAQRVSIDGKVLDEKPLTLATLQATQGTISARVAANRGGFLVVWQDSLEGAGVIHGVRVSLDGKVLDRQALLISAGSDAALLPAVHPAGDGFQVVFSAEGERGLELRGATVSSEGVVTPGERPLTDGQADAWQAGLGSNGRTHLAAYELSGAEGEQAIQSLLLAEGQAAGEAVTLAAGAVFAPDVASDGAGYLVAFETSGADGLDLAATLVDGEGQVRGEVPLAADAGNQQAVAVDFGAKSYLAAWNDMASDGTSLLVGRMVGTDGQVGDPFKLAYGIAGDSGPAAAFDGRRHLVVFKASAGDETAIYGTFVTP